MLSLYRAALLVRKTDPQLSLGGFEWIDSAPGVISFRRGDSFECVTNLSDRAIPVPASELVLSSIPLDGDLLPVDSTAWFRR